MDRRWLPAVLIAGGALVLVAATTILSVRTQRAPSPSAPSLDPAADPAPGARIVADDSAASVPSAPSEAGPARVDAVGAVAETCSSPAAHPVAAGALDEPVRAGAVTVDVADDARAETANVAGDSFDGGAVKPVDVAARTRANIAKVQSEIVALEAASRHDEAEQRRGVLRRLQAQLDVIQGGP